MKRTEAPGSLNNLYIDRNLDIGREGTLLIAEDRNAIQEEIANTIEKSGRTLDAGDNEQLSKSVLLTGGDPQTVDKVVTLGEIPVLPSSNPTQANQATRKGYVDSLDAQNVKITGNQNVDGVKTFEDIPVLPSSNPTQENQATRKGYVDSLDAQNVKTSGNQNVDGVKTFEEIPVLPSSNPTQENQATRKGYVDSLDAQNVKVTGNQTVGGDKEFTGTISGNTTFSGTKSFTGAILPRTDPVSGFQQIAAGSLITPSRGLYLSGVSGDGIVINDGNLTAAAVSGQLGGPFSGTTSTRVRNNTNEDIGWNYKKF